MNVSGVRGGRSAGQKSGQLDPTKKLNWHMRANYKLQITSTKFQINLKFQTSMTKTPFDRPATEGNFSFRLSIQYSWDMPPLWHG
jgi:hypothetical protein